MNKQGILKKVNVIMAVVLLLQPVSGFLYSATHWDFFEGMHVFGGVAFLVLVAIHLALNWGWVRTNILKPSKETKDRTSGPDGTNAMT